MKQFFLISCTILLLTFQGVFFQASAQDCGTTCSIQDAPADVLQNYLDNISQVISNVSRSIGSAERETTTIKKAQSNILASMSQVLNFSGYFSSFDFYVAIPMTQEVPYPVKRDHERLKRQSERLTQLLQKTTKGGYGEAVVSNACDGVSEGCNFPETNVRGVLTALLKNNKYIVDFYRLSIADKSYVEEYNFILVGENFQSEMQKNYNKATLTQCSACDEGFMQRMKESIDKISNLNNGGSEGIRKWKDAWAQLTGAPGQSTRTKSEDKILSEYLAGQGLPSDASTAVTDNLSRYNSGGLSTSNPLFNSANYTFTNAKEEIDTFREGTLMELLDTSQEDIPLAIINSTIAEVQTTQNIKNDIQSLYETQLQFLPVQDTKTQQIIAKIIRMHVDLSAAINILDKTVKTSEKVCNSQGQGQGKCSYQ